MARVDLGRKHSCASCGAKFYDLGREPATCPACGAVVEAEGPRSKRPARVLQLAAVVEDRKVGADLEEDLEDEDEDEDLSVDKKKGAKKAGRGRDVIEDVSELGEDEDDVVRVVGETDERD
jgi:uncharacterized protein (TIGR02300 family)